MPLGAWKIEKKDSRPRQTFLRWTEGQNFIRSGTGAYIYIYHYIYIIIYIYILIFERTNEVVKVT